MKEHAGPGSLRANPHGHACTRFATLVQTIAPKRDPKDEKRPIKSRGPLPASLDGRISFLDLALDWHGSRIGAYQFQDEHSASAVEVALEPFPQGSGPGSMCVFLTLKCKRLQKMKKQPRMRDTALVWLPIEAVIAHTPRRWLAPAPFAPAPGVTESFGVAA